MSIFHAERGAKNAIRAGKLVGIAKPAKSGADGAFGRRGDCCGYGDCDAAGTDATTLAIIAGIQKSGGTVAYIDISQSFDSRSAITAGVDAANLVVAQPDSAENAVGICTALAESGAVDAIVVDGAAMLVPEKEMFFTPGFDGYEPPPPPEELMAALSAAVRRAGILCVFAGMPAQTAQKPRRSGLFAGLFGFFRRHPRNESFANTIYAAMDVVVNASELERCAPEAVECPSAA